MSEQVSLRDFFDEKFDHVVTQIKSVDEKADTIIGKQDITNGRVRNAEKAIAVLGVVYTIGAAIIGWIVYKLP